MIYQLPDVFDEDRYFASGKESQYFQLTENNVKTAMKSESKLKFFTILKFYKLQN